MGQRKLRPTIYVVSDGRGQTAAQVLQAALVQFGDLEHHLVREANVRTVRRIESIVRRAAREHAVIFYTLVSGRTRQAMNDATAAHSVPNVDLLGPALNALHDLFRESPSSKPGLLYEADRERFDRLDAIDYTLKHDDGRRLHELDQADVVLVGVSRVSKSSTCFYLAYAGVRAANVPLVPDYEPPEELLNVDRQKVIGLRMNVSRLMLVREVRAENLGFRPASVYTDKRAVAREVNDASRLMMKHRWRSFDCSYMAIEEIAKEVLRLRGFSTRRSLP